MKIYYKLTIYFDETSNLTDYPTINQVSKPRPTDQIQLDSKKMNIVILDQIQFDSKKMKYS
jgi:hypothetical protein